jgi:hypothetical protein
MALLLIWTQTAHLGFAAQRPYPDEDRMKADQ